MRVFFISPGRTATTTLAQAFSSCVSWTSAHESNTKKRYADRCLYAQKHVEADNRLVFFLPRLTELYAASEMLVIVRRDRKKIANSYRKRWWKFNLPKIYVFGILMRSFAESEDELIDDMVDWIYDTIFYHAKNWNNVVVLDIEQPQEGFAKIFEYMQLSEAEAQKVKDNFSKNVMNENSYTLARTGHIFIHSLKNLIWDINHGRR